MSYTENIERLKILLTGASTDVTITSENEAEYKRLKSELNKSAKFKPTNQRNLKFALHFKNLEEKCKQKAGMQNEENILTKYSIL
jgi:hypothetical protein